MAKSPKKQWTVMVWMAGDNDLEAFGDSDLRELKTVGCTSAVDVLVQFDRMRDAHTRRYHVRKGTSLGADAVADLGETNTGDPKVAADFFTWGIAQYPAERYLAVLWNHGSGIDESDIYERAKARGMRVQRRGQPTAKVLPRSHARAIVSRSYRRALFASTVDQAIDEKAIAIDDTSRDFLDNIELQRVLTTVSQKTKRKIDLVGFDACLMNMVEIAYQLRGRAGYIVGSEETEPGDGWPYDKILADLAAHPTLTPAQLGTRIVRRYVASYGAVGVTQSLLDLAQTPALAKAVDALGKALLKALPDAGEYAAVTKAVNATQSYALPDFLDLHDLAEQLRQRVASPAVKDAAWATRRAPAGPAPFVVAEGHKGATVARSHGAAIFFPRGRAQVAYARLDFAKQTAWGNFLNAYGAP
jgi:hypothetical protein